jgi:hypothetical protein
MTGASSSNCTLIWGDYNSTLSIQLNHHGSNLQLFSGSTLLTQCNAFPIIPNQSNAVTVKQSLSQVKLYINNNLQFAYTNSEFNPVAGAFQISCSTSNVAVSNMIDDIEILPVYTVSNAAEFLQPTIMTDVKVASLTAPSAAISNLSVQGVLSNLQLSSLSNQVQGVASSLSALSNTINSVQSTGVWTLNQVNTYFTSNQNFSNDIYPRYTFTSNQSTFASNQSVAAQTTGHFCSNLIPTFITSNVFYPLRAYDSNTATWSSNQIATLATTATITSFSNTVFSSMCNLSNAYVASSNTSYASLCNLSNDYIASSNTSYASLCNLSNAYIASSNTSYASLCNLSNAYIASSNTSYASLCNLSNAYVVSSNTSYASLCNLLNAFVSTSNNLFNYALSNNSNTIFGSNTSVWSSNNFSNVSTSNIVFAFINSNATRSTWSSNNQSNLQTKSGSFPYGQLTGAPSFDSTNNAVSVGGAVLGAAGLALGGYNLFNGSGYVSGIFQQVANATSDFINLASGYQKLTNYIEIGTATTRYADGVITMK